jgi:hypothetical protein
MSELKRSVLARLASTLVGAGAALVTYQPAWTAGIPRTAQARLADAVHAADFGVLANGVADDTAAMQAAINYAFANSRALELPAGTIITSGTLSYAATGSESIAMYGKGAGLTTILNTNYLAVLSITGNTTNLTKVTLRGFSIGRNNAATYTGAIGPKSLYVAYAVDSVITEVEEFGGIGYGIQFDLSNNVAVNLCEVHDGKGGATGPTGTDGIHFYRSTNYSAFGNKVWNRGDDCISQGSYASTNPAQGGVIMGNRCYSGAGSGVKVYGLASEVVITGNNIDGTLSGGVQISDDFFNFTGTYGPSLNRIKITANQISNVTGGSFNIGGVYLNGWSGGAAGLVSAWTDIEVSDNQIYNCNSGVGQRGGSTDLNPVNLTIDRNRIDMGGGSVNTGHGVYLTTWYGLVNIRGNQIYNAPNSGIWLDVSGAPYLAGPYTNARIAIEDNTIDTWNTSLAAAGTNRGVWVRSGDISVILSLQRNTAMNQQSSDASAPASAFLIAGNSPLSVIAQNYTDWDEGPNWGTQLANGYQGEPTSNVVPAAGTWYALQKIWNSNPQSGSPPFWVCATSGTFGTLNGGATTGTINSGSRTLTVNANTGLYKGAVISIAGAGGPFVVDSVNGTAVNLNGTATASVTAAAVSFTAPTFHVAANFAS